MKKLIFNIVALLLLGSSMAVAVDIFPPGPGLRFFEQAGNGQNYKAFAPPAAISSNTTCTFENDANFIPDSCVGNGVDDAIGDGNYGDVTVSGGGTVITINANSVALGTDTTGGYAASASEAGPATTVADADFGDVSITAGVWSVDPNSVALGTDTTGNYAAGDAEAGNALTGDSATAFFTTGALEMARGGTGDGAAASDDQALVSDSTSAATWRTLPDSDGATQKLQYDQATNTFSAGTDDDVPEAGDFGALTGGTGIANAAGTLNLKYTDTLASNPAFNANECVFTTTGAGGGFLCEGSVADAFEGNFKFPDVTGADSTQTLLTDATAAGGDLTGTYPNPTVAANAVALTTDTTGNYMADIAAGVGIATTHTPAEGSTGTIAFDFSDAGADPALAADTCRFTGDATTNGEIVCEGDTANAFETRIVITDPTADRAMTIPNADSNPVQPLTCGSTDKVSAIGATGAITCTADVSGGSLADADYGDIVVSGGGTVWTVDSNSVALTTDTTGNYAAGDAEAGNALTGDSATAFFSAGALEVARGGNGAAPGADDQVMISDSSSAGTFRTLTDSDGANKALQYDQATNTFSAMQVQESMCLALGDETTAITTGTKIVWTMPYAFTLTSVTFSVTTQSTSGLPTLNVLEDTDAEGGGAAATTIFSTKPTIDANERRSSTAATASVLSDSSLAANSEMSAAIDVAGTGTKGPKLCLIGHQ